METIQKCASAFRNLVESTLYTYHVSINGKVTVFNLDFNINDFKHASGLHYLSDLDMPENPARILNWILDDKRPVTDKYLSLSKHFMSSARDEKDIPLRISELAYIEEYLDISNNVYIYSPKDSPTNNSLIKCDYIIESYSAERKHTVYIFIRHRSGIDSNCGIVSFCVKKNTSYGGIYCYIMLKKKYQNGITTELFRHKKYSIDQSEKNEQCALSQSI